MVMAYFLYFLAGVVLTTIIFLIRELRYRIRTQNLFDELIEFKNDMYVFAENLTEKTEDLINDLYEDNQDFKEDLYKILEDEDIDEIKLNKLYNRETDKIQFDTDTILEKINNVGFENLTKEEKEFLKNRNERRN